MIRAVWFVRWHVARFLIHMGLKLAPKGPARTLLVDYLNKYGREVMSAIGKPKAR